MNSEHSQHDRVLVARYAAGDAYPGEADTARDLLASCDECAALAADIALISARTSELPAIRRPRDFRISAAQAERLRGSWFERLMRGFSAPGWSVARPLAAAALAIGLVFIAVGALPMGGIANQDVHEAVPANSSQAGGAIAATAAPAELPQPSAAATERTADAEGATPQPQPQPATTGASAPEGAAATAAPGTVFDSSTLAPASAGGVVPPPEAPSTPAKAAESAVPDVTAPAYAYVVPTAAATAAPVEDAATPAVDQVSPDRSWLVVAGLLIAFLALVVLALVWLARNRYQDRLVR